LDRVIEELTEAGYDCRWCMLSAADVGAKHKRERWFMLATRRNKNILPYPKRNGCNGTEKSGCDRKMAESERAYVNSSMQFERMDTSRDVANPCRKRTQIPITREDAAIEILGSDSAALGSARKACDDRWGEKDNSRTTQPNLGGMADGLPFAMEQGLPDYLTSDYWQEEPEDIPRVTEEKEQRVDRIKRLGNAVVPLQVRTAFEYLMG